MTGAVYLSVKNLAARYSVQPRTVWRWTAQGRLPQPYRLGDNCTRWKLSEVEAAEALFSRTS